MCKKMGVCKHCPKCMVNRAKKDDLGASKIPSFFKVILNDEYLDILFLPPKFAREFTSMANKKIQIKDTTGRQWSVALSYVDDDLAFVQGWRTFVLDHGIVVSDIVTVRHISGSDFVCQIFGKSGCVKKPLPSASYNTASFGSADKDSSTFSNSRVNVNFTQSNKERLSTSPGIGVKRKSFEDPCCIVNRDIDFAPKVLDLSEFEMCRPVSDIGSSSFVDDLLDYSAFDEAMRNSCDIGHKDSSKHEIYGQNLPENCPSTAAGPSMEAQTAAFQCQTTTLKDQGPSLEAQTATFQGQTTTTRDQGPSLDAHTTAFPCQTTTLGDGGPSVEAQTADLEDKAAAFQDVVKDPESFGNERGESVTIAKNERTEFNPEGFGGSVRIDKEEHKQFNPVGLGGTVRNIKEEHKMFNPKGLGGNARIVKEEQMKFNPKSFGVNVRIVKEEQTKFNPKSFGPSLEAQTAAFHTAGSVGNVKKEHKMFNPEGFGGGVRIVKQERMEFNPKSVGGIAQRVHEKFTAKSVGGTGIVGKVKKEPMDFNPEHFGTSQVLKRVKAEAVDFNEPPPPLAVTCLVTSDNDFLVLPAEFSLLGYRRSMDLEKKVVVLRDSAQKLWSLLCCKINGMQVLTSGWKSFKEANRIQTGDECVFEVEDKFENIFKINVVRKA